MEAAFEDNDALKYAAVRNILHRKGKEVEILANYEPSVHSVSYTHLSDSGKYTKGQNGQLSVRDDTEE